MGKQQLVLVLPHTRCIDTVFMEALECVQAHTCNLDGFNIFQYESVQWDGLV